MSADSQSDNGCLFYTGIAVAWVGFWYIVLKGQYSTAVSGLSECGWSLFETACSSPWTRANNAFASGMLFAILSTPLPIYLVTRWRTGAAQRAERMEQRRQEQAQALKDKESRQRIADLEQVAKQEKSRINRAEFIQSLGAASAYLEELPFETDQARQRQIRQNISKELRDIVATYTMAEMEQILRDDPAIRIKSRSMLRLLERTGMESSDAAVIGSALQTADPE